MSRNYIKFLGTAGARIVVSKQLRSSGGTLISLDGSLLLLDPGPGTLVRCARSKPKIDPTKLDGIILTHRHIDHSTDINVMIEAMTEGGFRKKGKLYAPRECLEGEDSVVFNYAKDLLEGLEVLRPHGRYQIGSMSLRASGPHRHPAETYGVIFESSIGDVAFMADTEYFPELVEWYPRADFLVMNVVRLQPHESGKVMHLCLEDARSLITSIRPKVAILTHFGMTMIRAKPWELAEKVSIETGVKVLAASDGMTVALDPGVEETRRDTPS